ncbi:FAD:protein FMN transferase [Actinosynnema sp. NPDC020468]|uniref:FAD:protein FMN transferase n=1 Tax=Actinosynnema sp. NPDC020468 TaxID=3154488 RepID=UPI003402AB7A
MTAAVVAAARYAGEAMGTSITLDLRGRHADDDRAHAAWAAVTAVLRHVDRVFGARRNSFVSRLGRGEIGLADCPPEVVEVLRLGERAERESGGAFAATRPGPDGTAVFDPGGVVGGWAAERAASHLRALPATDFRLSVGGGLVCRTLHPGSEPWRVGVAHPHQPKRVVAVVPVFTGAVATSVARPGGVVDARTGRPPADVASVTVVADSLTWAAIDATAAHAQGAAAVDWLGARTGRTGLVVWRDGTTTVVG